MQMASKVNVDGFVHSGYPLLRLSPPEDAHMAGVREARIWGGSASRAP